MDKTVSISIGGFSFVLDEIAYNKLKTYLQDVKTSLRGTEGVEDIIEDVEIRISELFRERLKFREVVNEDDINFVIATMGHPDQYKVEEDEENEKTSTNSSYNYSTNNQSYGGQQTGAKRLYRDPDDTIVTGLSAGLAHYMGVDPWFVRSIWLVLGILGIFTAGVSFFLVVFCYFILLIFVPKAKTTSEKLQMYGQPANIDTLKKNVEQASEAVVSGSKELSNKLGGAFGVFGRILLWFIGFIILSTGIGLIIGGFFFFFTTWTEMPTELFGYLVEEEWMSMAAKIFGGVLMVIPGVLLTILGVKCFWNRVKVSKAVIFGAIALWFVALFAIIGISVSTASKFRNSVEMTQEKSYVIPSDTLQVYFRENNEGNLKFKTFNDLDQLIDADGNLIIPIDDIFEIEESTDDKLHIQVTYSSKGGSKEEAKRNLEAIRYNYELNGNKLYLDEFIKIPKDGKFRNQTVDIKLYIPKNKLIHTNNTDRMTIINNDNDRDYLYDLKNKFIGYNGKKFVCLNCQKDSDSEDDINLDSEDVNINLNDGNDSARVRIDKNGIRVESKDGSVGLNLPRTENKKEKSNQEIHYKDDTDSININYRNHSNNR
ncbi:MULTISPECIES: PspC domain-containing protein [Empedobacter]|uniref:PspC domain-containing protein n=1 Tax=Empedobacter falsenii TaxID=343874 RepID=A0A3R8SKM1_9FLAO|nr:MULTISPECIES: PspC domain-containing protein [Empedobacter]MDH1602772.1 PspC domain-containing protein [Empedobacter sp. GD03739]RRT88616.1 PspC domain-containing protein [Empedobacter falsenii]RRT89526.1 PspC domain-containing protein [Empedobacter falsenii]